MLSACQTQSTDVKSVVATANDAFRPAQECGSKKSGDYMSYNQCIQLENRKIDMHRENNVLQYVLMKLSTTGTLQQAVDSAAIETHQQHKHNFHINHINI